MGVHSKIDSLDVACTYTAVSCAVAANTLCAVDDAYLATVRAIVDEPRNAEQFARSQFIVDLFPCIIAEIPDQWKTLFEIAERSQTVGCFRLLVDYAIDRHQTQKLTSFFIHRAVHLTYKSFIRPEFFRLLAHAPPAQTWNVIRAANPKHRPVLFHWLSMQRLWLIEIQVLLEARQYADAYRALIQAAMGFCAEPYEAEMRFPERKHRDFLQQVKLWRQSDEVFWFTYGRAPNLIELIRLVFSAHVRAGHIAPLQRDDFLGQMKVPIVFFNTDSQGELVVHKRSRVTLPHAGLVARYADPHTIHMQYMPDLPGARFVSAPNIQGARLHEPGAMLQKLIVHYMDRYLPI